MATTALSIIKRALRLCGVVDSDMSASATDTTDAFDTLNAMLAEWYHAQIGFPDFSFATLTTAISTDDADREAIAYALADRIAPEYGTQLSPEAQKVGAETMHRFRLRYFQPVTVDWTELPYRRYRSNILTG